MAEYGEDERRLRKAAGFATEQEKLRIDREIGKQGYRANYRGVFCARGSLPGFRWREREARSILRSR